MDGNRFDDFARTLAGIRTRRSVLRALGLALGAGAVGAVALDDSDAAETCRPGGTLCRKPGECCSGACTPDVTGRGRCACEAGTTPWRADRLLRGWTTVYERRLPHPDPGRDEHRDQYPDHHAN
jgi:hypothetical protein